MVRTWLEEAGYTVVTAQDGTAAMTKAGQAKFDLFILDLDLAGESGVALMSFLKENNPGVPIVLYTGTDNNEDDIQAMRSKGAHSYLTKGKKEDLVGSVRKMLKETFKG